MDRYKISGGVFIRDSFKGAFMLPESLINALCFCDDVLVLDLGSTDGTREFLRSVSESNPRIRVIDGNFNRIDAGVFADLANELISQSRQDNVFYWQSDEILHEDLFPLLAERFDRGEWELSFWRVQFKENFQKVRWYPHVVHRIGQKGHFNFTGDGMNTNRTWDAKICSLYNGGYYTRWMELPESEFKICVKSIITDISKIGGFLENIIDRTTLHGPFWREEPNVDGESVQRWYERERHNPNWKLAISPYPLPKLLRWHVGKTKYELRPDLLEALKTDKTNEYISSL